MKTFVALTDFSKNARHASAYALQLARRQRARLLLVHVFQTPIAISEYELTTIHFDNMEERILRELEERKADLIAEYGEEVPIECRVYNRYLVERIQELFTDPEVKLAMIGLTGSGMTNFFLGSNTLDIVYHTGRLILTVPPYCHFRPIRNIVFACNVEDAGDDLPVEKIKKVLSVFDAQLFVLHVSDKADPAMQKKEEQTLGALLQGIDYSFHRVAKRNIVAGIKDFAREIQADLIAIIPRKHDFWEGLLGTNHTKAMLFKSDVPILSIPAKES